MTLKVAEYNKLKIENRLKFWNENPINGNIKVRIPGINTFEMYSENDDNVLKNLYWTHFKGWEHTSLLIWNFLVNNVNGVVLDIGAYTGIYSLISGLNPLNRILSFDIQKICIDRINENKSLNGLKNIEAYELGLGSSNQSKTYYTNNEYNFISSIAGFSKHKRHNSSSNIETRNGDTFLRSLDILDSVSTIKIDVEGEEAEVIIGLTETINICMPNMIIEILNRKQLSRIKGLLPKAYSCYAIDEKKQVIKRIKTNLQSIFGATKNYLFTTDDNFLNKLKF